MLLVLRVVFAVIAIVLSMYDLMVDSNGIDLFPYILFFLGAAMLVMGISELKAKTGNPELKAKRKANAIMSFFASVLCIFVSIYLFF